MSLINISGLIFVADFCHKYHFYDSSKTNNTQLNFFSMLLTTKRYLGMLYNYK